MIEFLFNLLLIAIGFWIRPSVDRALRQRARQREADDITTVNETYDK